LAIIWFPFQVGDSGDRPAAERTVRDANRLVVLDRGRVVEVGSHDELMAAEGHYYRLYQAQARNIDVEDDLRALEIARRDDEERQ